MQRALFIGRFQPFHNAHLRDIRKILKEANEVLIAVGSSQESNTLENPFSYEERKQMITKVLKSNKINKFRIFPVPDLFDDEKWAKYIIEKLPTIDVVYSGNPWTLKCFKKYNKKVKRIRLEKGISSTIVRKMMAKDENWQKLVPEDVTKFMSKIAGVVRIKNITQTPL